MCAFIIICLDNHYWFPEKISSIIGHLYQLPENSFDNFAKQLDAVRPAIIWLIKKPTHFKRIGFLI
jgi:hypothetical protein